MVPTLNDKAKKTQQQLVEELAHANARISEMENSFCSEVPVGFFRTDSNGHCTYVNNKWCEITGLSTAQALGGGWSLSLYEEDRENVFNEWQQAIKENRPFEMEYRFQRDNQQLTWVTGRTVAERNDKGDITGYLGTITDITRQKLAEASLRQSEARFRNIIDISPIPYALNDEQQNITYLNPAFIKTFGYDLSDIPTLTEWWPKAYPDENYRQWVADTWQNHLQQARQTGKPFDPIEIVICGKDGSKRNVLASVAALTDNFQDTYLVILYDITDRKQSENELQKTVAMLENVVNSTPDLIFVKNKKLQAIFCNQAYASAVGKTREDMYGHTDIENGWDPVLIHGDPDKGIRGFIHDDNDALSGIGVHNPYDPANVEGDIHIFDTHKLPLRDASNEIIGILGISRDITERKHSEDQLKQQKKLLGEIAANYPNSYLSIINKNMTIGFTSGQAFKKAGLNPEDYIGLSVDLVFGEQSPQIKQHFLKAFAGEENSFELFINNQYQLYHCIPLYEDNNEINRILSVAKDISHRKQIEQAQIETEQRLRLATEATGLGLWQWNLKTNTIHWDVQMFRIYGLEPTTDGLIDYSDWKDAVLPKEIEQQEAILQETVRNHGQSHREFRIRRHNDEEIRIIHAIEIARVNAEGETEWVVGTNLDITSRVQTEEQLRHSQKMDALGNLTGGIAHDFNNMLGVIMGYTELLLASLDNDPTLQHYAEAIFSASSRANTLTSKLLAFSRKQITDASPTNINHLLQRDQHMLEKTLTARIELIVKPFENLWPVFIDEEMLADAILNMCINSMHAMPDGGTISISTENVNLKNADTEHLSIEPGDYIRLTLTDTGIGMSQKILDQIFEPFFTTKGEHGAGLGMSQVYGLVKQSRGDIRVASKPGQGTTIIIYLPRHQDNERYEKADTKIHTNSKSDVCETILVVDDEPALQQLVKELLSAHGYRVLCANSGEHALDILNTEPVDLVFSDVIMPEMDGFELANRIQDKYPDIIIQMVSGYNDDYFVRSANKELYKNQLDKPYRTDVLLRRIRELLDKKQLK